MIKPTTDEALKNAIASAKMEGLNPTEADMRIIKDFVNHKISHKDFVDSVLSEIKRS